MPCFVAECATRQSHAGDLRGASHCAGKLRFFISGEEENDGINVKQVHMTGEQRQRERRIPAAIFH